MGRANVESAHSSTIVFGTFRLDRTTGELWRNGRCVRLPDKPLRVLVALLEAEGEIVSRDELRRRLWAEDTFVDFDNNLNAAVNKLRETLNDQASNPRFVETVPKKGYRFIAPIHGLREGDSAEFTTTPQHRRGWWLGLGLAVGIALTALALWPSRPAPPEVATQSQRDLLAVLPLDDLSEGGNQGFLADGLTEELIATLSRLNPERLGVIARTSSLAFRDSPQTVHEIGEELGADYLIEGSVRRDDDRLRFTAQLVRTSDQTHLWAQSYDRGLEDVLSIQEDLARRVAQSLALQLMPGEWEISARAGTVDPQAYEVYLKGRDQWNRHGEGAYAKAVAYLEEAIALDPEYAVAWAALADSLNLMAYDAVGTQAIPFYQRAREAAHRALELEPRLAEAHNSLGFVATYGDHDFETAVRHFERAFELNPSYAMACHWSAASYSVLHRHDEAIAAVHRAESLDPKSQSVSSDAGWYYLFADRYAEGVATCRQTLAEGPYDWANACIQVGLVSEDRYAELATFLREIGEPLEEGLEPREGWLQHLRSKIEEELEAERPRSVDLAIYHAMLGEQDEALGWLEQAASDREGWLVFLRVDPRFDVLQGQARFEAIADELGLPPPRL